MNVDNKMAGQQALDLPEWGRVGNKLVKSFTTDDFHAAARFVDRVASAAEASERYPDIAIHAGVVTIGFALESAKDRSTRTTVADADLAFARRIQRLIGDHHHPIGLAGP
jgi:pterin-4a-carbinolamine dehydratase